MIKMILEVHNGFHTAAVNLIATLATEIQKCIALHEEKLVFLLTFPEPPLNPNSLSAQIQLFLDKYHPPPVETPNVGPNSLRPICIHYGPTVVASASPLQSRPNTPPPDILAESDTDTNDVSLQIKLEFPPAIVSEIYLFFSTNFHSYFKNISAKYQEQAVNKISTQTTSLKNELTSAIAATLTLETEIEATFKAQLTQIHKIEELKARRASFVEYHIVNLKKSHAATIQRLSECAHEFTHTYTPAFLTQICAAPHVSVISRLAHTFQDALSNETKSLSTELEVSYLSIKKGGSEKGKIKDKWEWTEDERDEISMAMEMVEKEAAVEIERIQVEIEGVAAFVRVEIAAHCEDVEVLETIEKELRGLRRSVCVEITWCENLKKEFLESLNGVLECGNIQDSE
ncbi:hypothetical protein HK096_010771, partial [Nowakowskiella sp. JEL0078]